MSSKKGGGTNSVGHLNQGMADVSLDSNGRKSRNKNGSGIAVNRGGGSSAAAPPPPPRAWGQLPKNSGAGRSAGRGNLRRRQQQQTRTKSTKSAKSAPFSKNIKGSLFPRRQQQQQTRTNGMESQYMAPAAPPTVVSAPLQHGKWKGLNEMESDREIIWPPMVVIMNTLLDKDENDKWTGMGNQELVEYFSSYAAARACHSCGPNGHRGMSVLIFEPTAVGFMEAERLHRHFQEQGTDLIAWESRRCNLFTSGGKRQLYGYLARKEDMEEFNQHSHGQSQLKYELRSYNEVVVTQMKQINEDNQNLTYLKNKVVEEEHKSKALEETCEVMGQKLRETMEENRIVRLRTKLQYEEMKEEMDFQDKFFKEQMDKFRKITEEKEKNFERLLQEERAKASKSDVCSGTYEDKEAQEIKKLELARSATNEGREAEA